jgi:hypothetical protein
MIPLVIPEGTFLMLVGAAGVATLAWMLRPFDSYRTEARAVAPLTLISTSLWAIIALQGGQVTRTTQCCRYYSEMPYVQFFGAGMAILSFAAFVLWYFGNYPPQDEAVENDDEAPAGADAWR